MYFCRLACGQQAIPIEMIAVHAGDLVVMGRLAPNTTFTQAKTEMEYIAAGLAKKYREDDQYSVAMMPLRQAFAGDMWGRLFWFFLAR